jgi:hypothetical protein
MPPAPSRPRAAGTAVLVLMLLAARAPDVGRAQDPPTARLEYGAPPGPDCPDEQAFRDLVTARLGHDPFEPLAPLRVTARIEPRAAGLHAEVHITGDDGSERGARELEGAASECRDLANALASAVTLALTLPPAGEAPAAPAPQPAPPPSPPVAPPAPGSTRHPLGGTVRAGFAAGGAITPGFALSPVASVGLRSVHYVLLAEGRIDVMPGSKSHHGESLAATVYSAGPAFCASVLFHGCLAAELGAFQGRAEDVSDSRWHASFFAAAAVRLGMHIVLDVPYALVLTGELRVPLVRTSLEVDDRTVWSAPSVGGGLRAELSVDFL